ncbi:MAG: hypothetical protein M1832_001107 [Thelocarpon impressellum]|nr:MAG: hypothetical protein M1832_001107 [Thelocarpon impressellum]
MEAEPQVSDYTSWSREGLVARVTELEKQLKDQASISQPSTLKLPKRPFDPSRYSTTLIALKIAYLGQRYNGFEHHANNATPLPTVEEELWRALYKARLIFPTNTDGKTVSWEGCEYSKCGRTDKGVSAFGQVIGIRVRSKRPLERTSTPEEHEGVAGTFGDDQSVAAVSPPAAKGSPAIIYDAVNDEINYPLVLNRLLPHDIRVLGWTPNLPQDFSARFSCRERRYRYFFTQPAFSAPGEVGLLDIDAMREAARHFVGVHDFRNFCKVDASKQITNFQRRIFHADIEEMHGHVAASASSPKLYAFSVHGSAFLWHQVRHMAAALFLIGQRLEEPSLISALLNVAANPQKPLYDMAADAPLVLWECLFPNPDEGGGSLRFTHTSDQPDLIADLWKLWRGRRIDEVLAGSLLDVVIANAPIQYPDIPRQEPTKKDRRRDYSQKVFDGGDAPRLVGQYVKVLDKRRMESVETINERYRRRMEAQTDVVGEGAGC